MTTSAEMISKLHNRLKNNTKIDSSPYKLSTAKNCYQTEEIIHIHGDQLKIKQKKEYQIREYIIRNCILNETTLATKIQNSDFHSTVYGYMIVV